MKEIPLSNSDLVAIVDDDDYDMLSGITWAAHRPKPGHTSARGTIHSRHDGYKWFRQEFMHRVIMGATKGVHVDHKNGDPLDNRRANLRLCTPQQNNWNQKKPRAHKGKPPLSRYKGVTRSRTKPNGNKVYSYWRAQIVHNGQINYLGNFKTEEEAARAYDAAATERFGEFAKLNFPNNCEGD